MGSNDTPLSLDDLPSSDSPSLYLTNPTPSEMLATWTLNSHNWGSALSLPDYLAREQHLLHAPQARDGGITHWILADRNSAPDNRHVLASCESLRRPVLACKNGVVTRGITHGIGSVFSNPQYRGRGYASRMLRELATVLKTHQTDEETPCPFSILYSDIGKKYYANLGWAPFPSTHLSFPIPDTLSSPSTNPPAQPLKAEDLGPLCALDEQYIYKKVSAKADHHNNKPRTRVALLPTLETIQWHHSREDFVTSKLFSSTTNSTTPPPPPLIKGAISSGPPGSRIWAIFGRYFYGPLSSPDSGNTFYILRLVIEDESDDTDENAQRLKSVLEIAMREAREWKLPKICLWNPSGLVKGLVARCGVEADEVVREVDSIASLMWYGDGSGDGEGEDGKVEVEDVEWVANEKFGWC